MRLDSGGGLFLAFFAGLANTQAVVKQSVPGANGCNWVSQGCYTDSGQQILATQYSSDDGSAGVKSTAVDVETCTQVCQNNNNAYCGMEAGYHCFGGNSLDYGHTTTAATECNVACDGDATEICGGGNVGNTFRISIYEYICPAPAATTTALATTTASTTPYQSASWCDFGCYYDSPYLRALRTPLSADNGIITDPTTGKMSNVLMSADVNTDSCLSFCYGQGFTFCGLELGYECWGDTGIMNCEQPVPATDPDQCNTPCTYMPDMGTNQYCGGSNDPQNLNSYRSTIYGYNPGGGSCPALLSANTATCASPPPAAGPQSTTSAVASTSGAYVAGYWQSQGCYSETASYRVLTKQYSSESGMIKNGDGSTSTVLNNTMVDLDTCLAFCQNAGSTFCGLTGGYLCVGDTAIMNGNSIVLASDPQQCNKTCTYSTGSLEYCGGFPGAFRVSVYQYFPGSGTAPTVSSTVSSPAATNSAPSSPAIVTTTSSAPVSTCSVAVAPTWSAVACYTDNSYMPTLRNQYSSDSGTYDGKTVLLSTMVDVTTCLAFCQNQSATYCGLEGGYTCYGDTQINPPGTVVLATDPQQCNNRCSYQGTGGGPTQYCGGGPGDYRIMVYQLTGGCTPGTASSQSGSAVAVTSPVVTTSAANSISPTASGAVNPSPNLCGWQSQGCYVDYQDMVLPVNLQTQGAGTDGEGAANGVNIENCLAACTNAGYYYCGTEFGNQCYGYGQIVTGTAPDGSKYGVPETLTAGQTTQCNMACDGNQAEICGGPNRLSLYSYTPNSVPGSGGGYCTSTIGSTTGSATGIAYSPSGSSIIIATTIPPPSGSGTSGSNTLLATTIPPPSGSGTSGSNTLLATTISPPGTFMIPFHIS